MKVGTGAFMKTIEDARELAATMVGLGTDHGVKTVALLTDMFDPAGPDGRQRARSTGVGGGPGGRRSGRRRRRAPPACEMLDAAGIKDADPAKALADGSAMDVGAA